MRLKSLEIGGFKSFAKKSDFNFDASISAIVGPNGSGKSNIAESFRFVLGEQSIKSMRGKKGEDLIFNGVGTTSKQNKATVKVHFDNTDRSLDIDYDEVIIERTVHRDGVNEYAINNSQVRLKDVSELLSGANIGSTGHHIISQGEADKILNATPKERRAVLEDALGLKIFQYKKTESSRKLTKTEENIAQVESLRKEIAPHIKFLKKQVDKLEKTRELREDLKKFYREYLKREKIYLSAKMDEVSASLKNPQEELREVNLKLEKVKADFDKSSQSNTSEIDNELNAVNQEISVVTRNLGQTEGEINSISRLKRDEERKKEEGEITTLDIQEVKNLKSRIDNLINDSENSNDVSSLRAVLLKIKETFSEFLSRDKKIDSSNLNQFNKEIEGLENKKKELENDSRQLSQKKRELEEKLNQNKEQSKGGERQIFELMTQKNNLGTDVNRLMNLKDSILRDEEEFKREMTEAGILVGREAVDIDSVQFSVEEILSENRTSQLERRRELEKMKIRVEEFGAGSGDEILKEYEEVNERDEFLIREVADLEQSSISLRQLISELDEQINIRFREGISKINNEFNKYFELMFGGGEAALQLVKPQIKKRKDTDIEFDEDAEPEEEEDKDQLEGVEINVSLPRKKIKGLMMLSGGERALTSIALIFAMSAVNPPPFIILDETDAALDEANSRKYADMIENLSQHSQLILITHNRETMSRAGVLYGVTMMQGVSQLLSIKLDEGVQYAK